MLFLGFTGCPRLASPVRPYACRSYSGNWLTLGMHMENKRTRTTHHSMKRITIGYHRLYSHRAFRASFPVRVILVILGSSAWQGSIHVRGQRRTCDHMLIIHPVVVGSRPPYFKGQQLTRTQVYSTPPTPCKAVCSYCKAFSSSFKSVLQTTLSTTREFQRCSSIKIDLTTTQRYAATRGLFYSHIGWIFIKQKYERIELIDKEDLVRDSRE